MRTTSILSVAAVLGMAFFLSGCVVYDPYYPGSGYGRGYYGGPSYYNPPPRYYRRWR